MSKARADALQARYRALGFDHIVTARGGGWYNVRRPHGGAVSVMRRYDEIDATLAKSEEAKVRA